MNNNIVIDKILLDKIIALSYNEIKKKETDGRTDTTLVK